MSWRWRNPGEKDKLVDTMTVEPTIITRRDQAIANAPITGQCFSNARSGELIRAVLIEGEVFILDEYGGHRWMSEDDFQRQYLASTICPLS